MSVPESKLNDLNSSERKIELLLARPELCLFVKQTHNAGYTEAKAMNVGGVR